MTVNRTHVHVHVVRCVYSRLAHLVHGSELQNQMTVDCCGVSRCCVDSVWDYALWCMVLAAATGSGSWNLWKASPSAQVLERFPHAQSWFEHRVSPVNRFAPQFMLNMARYRVFACVTCVRACAMCAY